MTQPTTLAGDEVVANILSIESVPRDVLPDGPARDALMKLAASGVDVYCYQAAGEHGPWNVWLQSLADRRPDRNGRLTVEHWRQWYNLAYLVHDAGERERMLQLMREMRASLDVPAPDGGAA